MLLGIFMGIFLLYWVKELYNNIIEYTNHKNSLKQFKEQYKDFNIKNIYILWEYYRKTSNAYFYSMIQRCYKANKVFWLEGDNALINYIGIRHNSIFIVFTAINICVCSSFLILNWIG